MHAHFLSWLLYALLFGLLVNESTPVRLLPIDLLEDSPDNKNRRDIYDSSHLDLLNHETFSWGGRFK